MEMVCARHPRRLSLDPDAIMKPIVWAIIATYRRPELLRRALTALRDQGSALAGVIIVDNGGTGELDPSDLKIKMVVPPQNLGTAGGIAAGLQAFFAIPEATHCWIMDDDTVTEPDTLKSLLDVVELSQAAVVTSVLINEHGKVAWYPGPLSQPAWNLVRSGVTQEEFLEQCGIDPLPWTWATWGCMLIAREAVQKVGLPNAKLWYQGTDIEYSLRLSAHFNCVLAPAARCHHLMPPTTRKQLSNKELWSLQNGAYVSVRLPHGHRSLRHLPGNHFRYWQGQGFSLRGLIESSSAFWNGAILGRPAGIEQTKCGQNLSKDWLSTK